MLIIPLVSVLEDDRTYRAYIDFQEILVLDQIFIAMLPVENAIGEKEISSLKVLQQSIDIAICADLTV